MCQLVYQTGEQADAHAWRDADERREKTAVTEDKLAKRFGRRFEEAGDAERQAEDQPGGHAEQHAADGDGQHHDREGQRTGGDVAERRCGQHDGDRHQQGDANEIRGFGVFHTILLTAVPPRADTA